MDIRQALEAMRNLGVTLNDYDTEALTIVCDFVEETLSAHAAPASDPAETGRERPSA